MWLESERLLTPEDVLLPLTRVRPSSEVPAGALGGLFRPLGLRCAAQTHGRGDLRLGAFSVSTCTTGAIWVARCVLGGFRLKSSSTLPVHRCSSSLLVGSSVPGALCLPHRDTRTRGAASQQEKHTWSARQLSVTLLSPARAPSHSPCPGEATARGIRCVPFLWAVQPVMLPKASCWGTSREGNPV